MITTAELRVMALFIKGRLLESGNPLDGDDWEMLEIVRAYLAETAPDAASPASEP